MAGGAAYWLDEGILQLGCAGGGTVSALDYAAGAADYGEGHLGREGLADGCPGWDGNSVGEGGYGPVVASSAFYQRPFLRQAQVGRAGPGGVGWAGAQQEGGREGGVWITA